MHQKRRFLFQPAFRFPIKFVLAMCLCCPAALWAATGSISLHELPKDSRLAIWGDSITEVPSCYPRYIEAYLLACAGRKDIKVCTFGHSGAQLGEMLSRQIDLKAFNPTIVMFNYGMNDSSYTPYTDSKGAAFGQTMQEVLAMLAGKKITPIVAGPPNVSPTYSGTAGMTMAQNLCLGHFSAIGRAAAIKSGAYFSDIFNRMQDACTAATAALGPTYGYGVHSGPNGCILMAYEDLKTLACDGNIGAINVDMDAGATASEGHTVVSASNGVVVLDSVKYPFCYNYDPNNAVGFECLDSMLPFVPFTQDLNRLVLKVTHLGVEGANVTWGGETRFFTSGQLAKGVNLAEQFTHTPFDAAFARVMAAILDKQEFENYMIKLTGNFFGNDNGGNVDSNMIAVQARKDAAVKALIVPVRHTIAIVEGGSNGSGAPVITGTMSEFPTVGQAFTYQISALNAPTGFSVDGLPRGLSLSNTTTGQITGTPTKLGVSLVHLTAKNDSGTGSAILTLTMGRPMAGRPAITSATTASVTVGTPFSYQITATNQPTDYFVTTPGAKGTEPPASSLPQGITYNTTTGLVSGTPTTSGTFTLQLAAMNDAGVTIAPVRLTIKDK